MTRGALTGMDSSLGQRVQQLRRERRLSQGDLAQGLASASHVSLIESGKRIPSQDLLAALAQRLGTTEQYLLTGETSHNIQEEQLQLRFAEIALANGSAAEARERFRELTTRPRDEIRLAALWGLARAEEQLGNHRAGAAILDECLLGPARDCQLGAPPLVSVHIARCRMYRDAGDYVRSVEVGEQALAEIRALGLQGTEDEIKLGATLIYAYWSADDMTSAQRLADEIIAGAERLGSREARGNAYWNACLVAESRGDLPLALSLAERTLALIAEASEGVVLACMRVTFAWLLLRCSPPRLDDAEAQLALAYPVIADAEGSGSDLQNCEVEMARAAMLRGSLDRALQLADHAVSLGRGGGEASLDAGHVRGLILIWLGEIDEGTAASSAAAEQMERSGARRTAAQAWWELGETLLHSDRHDAAIAAFRHAARCAGVRTPVISAPQTLHPQAGDGPRAAATHSA
jgi:transcriptional regulator with XRE-family HTH domain